MEKPLFDSKKRLFFCPGRFIFLVLSVISRLVSTPASL
jgi:hypothetical protein